MLRKPVPLPRRAAMTLEAAVVYPVVLFLFLALVLGGIAVYPAVMYNPSGGIAVLFSLLPFTAPLTMFLRARTSAVASCASAASTSGNGNSACSPSSALG